MCRCQTVVGRYRALPHSHGFRHGAFCQGAPHIHSARSMSRGPIQSMFCFFQCLLPHTIQQGLVFQYLTYLSVSLFGTYQLPGILVVHNGFETLAMIPDLIQDTSRRCIGRSGTGGWTRRCSRLYLFGFTRSNFGMTLWHHGHNEM